MEKRRSFVETPGALTRSGSRQSMRMSTRMKKVAPPPPPAEKAPPPPLSNGSVRRSVSLETAPHQRSSVVPGEDCAIDELLEGRMELEVVLPDCKVVRMTVDRRTPMMDLLVQATTSNKISPSDHTINLISRDERNVQYKPNTPIGALDANTVYIIPKSTLELPVKRMPKLANQPFEQTFRLQVNLPLNQRMVLRVSPRITLDELKRQICAERELDSGSHHLVHPATPDTVLDLNATLEVYGCAEISLTSSAGLRDSIRNSSTLFAHPASLRTEEEKKKRGILRLFSRKKKDFVSEIPSNGVHQQLTSSQSDGATLNRNSYQPKQSIKRKPAPAPPPVVRNSSPPLITQSSNSLNSRPESEISAKTADEVESSVSHSRHSSDSSGYHEPSVFSDCSENKSPEASIVHGDNGCVGDVHRQDSPDCPMQMNKRSSMTTNLKNVPSCSNVSIISTSRKRKAPQPPVSTLPAIESPSSPDAPPIDSVARASGDKETTKDSSKPCQPGDGENAAVMETIQNGDSKQQESEALQYLEDVLQESEKTPSPKMLDDSDTDSLKDDGEVISVCQAEVHANASDHDSPDSIVESHTIVAPVPQPHKYSFAPLSNPNSSQSAGCEEPAIPKLVPSDTELPAQNNKAEPVNTIDYESSVCDGATLHLSDANSLNSGESERPTKDQCVLQGATNRERKVSESEVLQKDLPSTIRTESVISSVEENKDVKYDKCNGERSSSSSISGGSLQSSTTVTPQSRKKLDNFVLSSYKKDNLEDIYSERSDSVTQHSENSCLLKNNDEKSEIEVPKLKIKSQPEVKIVSLKEKTETDCFESDKGNNNRVLDKCAHLNSISTLPLTGRCSSMYNLTPQKKFQKCPSEEVNQSVPEENMKRTQSDQNICKELKPVDLKACFLQEQRRLQEEYQRLQAQFISWQKQLMNNQSLLQNENILPQMPFTSLVSLQNLENSTKKTVSENYLTSKDSDVPFDQFKTRSLPRAKTKTLSLKEPARPKTPPIPSSPTEASIVDIDIGSESAPRRPDTLTSCSVNTQADVNLEDKVIQVPSPQDKVIQVPSPQEKVTSGTQVPSPETVKSKEDVSAQTSNPNLASPSDADSVCSEIESKSQTLPRPKPKPISAFQPSQTMTLNRKSMPKPQVVSVTIGSWQQRQAAINDIESANVASSRSKFQSLENIPQNSLKTVPSFMEKRKLPPVPVEATVTEREKSSTKPSSVESNKDSKSSKIVRESSKPSVKSNEKAIVREQNVSVHEETAVKMPLNTNKVSTAARQEDKHKMDVKLAAKEPAALFKSAKPFIKLSSMKDESHQPSIIGLRKWPLSDINENKSMGDGRQSIVDDLRATSKRPGGFVQDKIRRAEVDLRKPKSSKTEPSSETKVKELNLESTKPKLVKAESTSETRVKETYAEPSKLHITKVSITNKGNEGSKHFSQKKSHSSNVTTPVTAPSNIGWNNTIPKSQSLNNELMAVFSRKSGKDNERYKDVSAGKDTSAVQNITVNGSVQPPVPPPPPPPVQSSSSGMPTIPPAEQIPVSSQLLMGRESTKMPVSKKESKKSPKKFSRTIDPREELMLEIRGFGGKQALKKIPSTQSGWHLKVYGTASTADS